MLPFDCGANSFELYVCHDKQESDDIKKYTINLDKTVFNKLLSSMKNSTSYKFFQKEYKEYVYNNIIVENYKNTEVRVIKNQCILTENKNNWLLMAYTRSKLTFLSIPSTKIIHEINYVKKLIFRINNRIFVNFKIVLNDHDNTKTYIVYINYNHDTNLEQDGIKKDLQKVMDILTCSKH